MKALILEDKKTLSLSEVEAPIINENELLLTVEAVGIGGSEYLGFKNPGIRPLPNIMGHGFSGTLEDGKRVAVYPLQGCGKCLYCKDDLTQLCEKWSLIGVQSDGGFAQKAVVPKESLIPLDDDLTWEQSVFIEPFANSVNAWELSQATSRNSIAIIGAGSLGLGVIACAKEEGCSVLHVSDLSQTRLDVAKSLGATHISTVLESEFDIVFDTVGTEQSRDLALQSTKRAGTCVFLGFATPSQELNFSELIRYQKRLMGSFVYSKEQFKKAMSLAKKCDTKWVENLNFSEVELLLNKYINDDFSVIKAALRPNK